MEKIHLYSTLLYIQKYISLVILSVCLSGGVGDQILDQVQYSSRVCLFCAFLHLYQDHPQHPPVSEITQRLCLYRYTSAHLTVTWVMLLLAVAISTSITAGAAGIDSHGETNNINNVDKNIQPNTQDETSIWIPIHFCPVHLLMCHNSCEHVWLLCVCLFFSLGASDKAFVNPVVWLTALLTAWTAILPSLTAYALNVILTVCDKHKVRHMHHTHTHTHTHTDYWDSKKERWNVNLQRAECKAKNENYKKNHNY